jgi:TRAP transporter TAXI family solute receptor
MKRAFPAVLALALCLPLCERTLSLAASHEDIRQRVNDNVVFLMGGQSGATFNQLADDIALVVSDKNLRVLSVEGGAAVQNVEDVLYLRNIDMALTTLEAMNYLKATGELGPNLDSQLAYIAPLFPNPLQILARGGATTIRDLEGKKVNFNNRGSATAQFVPKIFKTLGINVQELYLPQGDAVEKLRRGEIDATICSCPGPVPAYVNVKPDWGLRFVTVPYEKSLQATYLPGYITSADYPALVAKDQKVDTISASTVLVSFNWPKGTIRYERTAKFVDAFFSKIYEFQKPPRSPLWKSVNVAATMPGWHQFAAAEEWIKNWREGRSKDQQVEFKRFLSERGLTPTPQQFDQLFRQFQSWTSAQ